MTDTSNGSGHGKTYDTCGAPKRQGEGTCTRPAGWGTPHPGIGRCKLHAGSTPSHVASAQQEQARQLLGTVLWDPAAKPVVDAVAAMQQLAGRLEHSVHVLGSRIGGDGTACEACGRGDLALDSPEAIAWLRVVREQRQLLEAMERLGIGTRYVQVEEDKLRLWAVAHGRIFDSLGLGGEQREAAERALFVEMRSLAGEVGA